MSVYRNWLFTPPVNLFRHLVKESRHILQSLERCLLAHNVLQNEAFQAWAFDNGIDHGAGVGMPISNQNVRLHLVLGTLFHVIVNLVQLGIIPQTT